MPKVDSESSGEQHDLVVVGSGGVGKSCLTVRFLKDEFTNDYDPTIEENYRKAISVDKVDCVINIIDTAGQQEYTSLRDQHLKDGKGFLLVFAVNDKATYEEIKQLREQILKIKDKKKVPMVLCGNKCDIPHEQHEVSKDDVDNYCQSIKIPYWETSAKENIHVAEIFQELVRECRRMEQTKSAKGNSKGGKKKGGGGCIVL